MNAQVTQAPDLVTIEVDGRPVAVPKGSMIIQATDSIGVPVPRFCYHKKLPIAANCRMCLVEVEKSPKPMPACATPVMDGMKVFTRSERALKSQRNVMEFLLINHPLDCPICDQGGECELQDVAMGYGRSVSRFAERKRVVADEDLGPLIATDMTRCIHCTRCVRFMTEIAGTTELGGMGRGEHLEIGTYVGKSIESELGGNIIDVCPVGALTNKVFRYRARPWELVARESVGYHDALHSNLFLHVRRGEVLRTVPRDNEAVNETWLSDRDRWSHQGLYAADRATAPLLRRDGVLHEVDWPTALAHAADLLRDAPLGQTGFLVGPATSCEEGTLLARLAGHLGSRGIDHRLGQVDFADDGTRQARAGFALPLADIERAGAVVLVGCDPHREAPLLGHRVRKAARNGAAVVSVNPFEFPATYPLAGRLVAPPSALVGRLARLAGAVLSGAGKPAPSWLAGLAGGAPDADDQALAGALAARPGAVVIVGDQANRSGQASALRALARLLADALGGACNVAPAGRNGVGLARAGVLPGNADGHVAAQLAAPRPAYVLYNADLLDFAEPGRARAALRQARTIAFCAHADEALREVAELILPIGLLPEIDATMVNVDGLQQQVVAGGRLPGSAQPGWRLLRALAELLQAPGFDFEDLAGLRAGMALDAAAPAREAGAPTAPAGAGEGLERIAPLPLYRADAVVRRAPALQATPLSLPPAIVLAPAEAARLGLADGQPARASAGGGGVELPVRIDAALPEGAVRIDAGFVQTAALPAAGRVRIEGAGP